MIEIQKYDFNHIVTKQLPSKNSVLVYYSLESNLKTALSRNTIMFFHKTSETKNKRELRERMNKEKVTKIYLQNDSQKQIKIQIYKIPYCKPLKSQVMALEQTIKMTMNMSGYMEL